MNVKRAAALAAVLLLAAPGVATAGGWTDSAGVDGKVINGSKLVTGVGGSDAEGAISVRFADNPIPLFYKSGGGVDVVNAAGNFVIHQAGTAYSASPWGSPAPFKPTSAPATTGSGSALSPWVVTSGFTNTDLGITQKVSHVDGSRALTLSWKVTNTTGSSVPFKAYWNADLYVSGSDRGTGALVAGPPRTLEGIAVNGTKAALIELTPWSHYFEGYYDGAVSPAWIAWHNYNDTVNPRRVDNGFGVEWDRTLAPHASTTFVLGFNAAEPGSAPPPEVAPDITKSPISGPSHSATLNFEKRKGDTATVSYECSIDGGQFTPCTSPQTYSRLSLGEHVFRVHGVNVNGATGPAAMAVWTINPPRRSPGSHPAVGLQSVTVAEHTLKVGCSLGSGKIAKCAVTLVTPGGVVVGRGVRVFRGAHQRKHGKVEVVLTARGRKLAAQPGGVRVVATATVSPVGGGTPLVARQTVHVVSPTVDVTPGELQFQSGSAVLLPGGRSYLLTLVGQLAGATRVVATGYTDAIGNAQANYRLGLARADTVCALISHRAHVACEALSYGEGHPRATNATAAGRALNRRVELRLTY